MKTETTRDVRTTHAHPRQYGYSAFVQDEWRATSRSSLTLTLRYEVIRDACSSH